MTIRAKFKVDSKELLRGTEDQGTVRLYPVISGSQENEQFYSYTPGGQILLSTVNPAAYERFEVGQEYYVDFTLAD